MDDTQLPAELDKKQMQDKALAYSLKGSWSIYSHPHQNKMFYPGTGQSESYSHYLNGLKDCATEWATKLHEADKKIRSLSSVIATHNRTYNRVSTELFEARALLEKFISRHDAGLLPDRFIYDEIKTFLDGTK